MKKNPTRKHSVIRIIGTDIVAILILLSVPFIGPLPGPGGIPLLLTGLGLLSINHSWAKKWLHYARKHSKSLRNMVFPDVNWVKWMWDIISVLLILGGILVNLYTNWWLLRSLSIGIMAGSTTIFIMNRSRIDWLDKKLIHKR